MAYNGRSGKDDKRGNNKDRKARKLYLLSSELFGGNGEEVYCIHGCDTLLTFATVEADRIVPGGSYRRDNVQPACGSCNKARSNDVDWVYAG